MTLREWADAEGHSKNDLAVMLAVSVRHIEPLLSRSKSPSFALAAKIIRISGEKVGYRDLERVSTKRRRGRPPVLNGTRAAAA